MVDGEGLGLDGGGDDVLHGEAGEVCAVGVAEVGVLAGDGDGAGDVGAGLVGVEDPTAPTEIGDLCEGLYGTGGGGGYIGSVMKDGEGRTFNLNGRNGRKFLVQWIWSPVLKACAGPNALD